MTQVEPKKREWISDRKRDENEACRKRDYKEKKLRKRERDVKLMNQGTKKGKERLERWHKWSRKKRVNKRHRERDESGVEKREWISEIKSYEKEKRKNWEKREWRMEKVDW